MHGVNSVDTPIIDGILRYAVSIKRTKERMLEMKVKILLFLVCSLFLFAPSNASALIIFEENFNKTALPDNWAFDSDGHWSIINNELDQSNTNTSGHADAWAGDLGWTDYSVETKFKFLDFGSNNMEAGLGLRHDYPFTGGNFAVTRVAWRGSAWNLELVRTSLPEIHIPLNQNLTLDSWYTMRSQIEGDHLQVWVNDILYDFGDISSPSEFVPSSGGIGLWANNAHVRFDDVIVDNLHTVPEPSSIFLFGYSLLGFGFIKKLGWFFV